MSYYKPTPAKWRKLGDSLLAVNTFIVGYGVFGDINWLAYSALGLGVIGKFLTNLFSE